MKIRGEGLELALRVVLSCPCPVTPDQERRVFELAQAMAPDEVGDYARVLAVFDQAGTPFHRLADFVRWMTPVDTEAVIEREHVLRANASSYHWEHAVCTLPGAVSRVSSLSSWLLAHMILPVRLQASADGDVRAVYAYGCGDGVVELRHVFLPPELAPAFGLEPAAVAAGRSSDATTPATAAAAATAAGSATAGGQLWAIHFAAVLGSLRPGEDRLLVDLLDANRQLAIHRERVVSIDYRDFELQGDNADFCRRRHAACWGG
jgi:hypothetical protein